MTEHRQPNSLGEYVALEEIRVPPRSSWKLVGQPESFPWPCDRREAHAAHDECPGVKAHPATMIGGSWKRW